MTQLLLTGPSLLRGRCPTCAGKGFVRLNPVCPRECPTCRGEGSAVVDTRFRDGLDLRAYQLGLAPVEVDHA